MNPAYVKPADDTEDDADNERAAAELAALLDLILAFLCAYIVFPSRDAAIVCALWVAHTWPFRSFDCTPYLHIFSPVKMCGKSRVLECLKLVCRAPWYTIQPTEAVLFRKIQAHCPTLLLDEIDTVFTKGATDPNKEGTRAVLNAGYERGATVPRCQGPHHELKDFAVFCPKAIAGLGNLPDTVASRSIKILLSRRKRGQKVQKLRKREAQKAAVPIIEGLKAWSSRPDVLRALRDARPSFPSGLSDRGEDIAEPLLAIAEMARGEWIQWARKALSKLMAPGATDEEEIEIQLLLAIREIFQTGNTHISSDDLLKALVRRQGEPFGALWGKNIADGNIDGPARKLAKLLKDFGIVPRPIREGGEISRGYPLEAFEDSFESYLPPLPKSPPCPPKA